MPDVSLIIPCYNSEALVEARVLEFEALLRRSPWTWEILLCDDGSSDQTPEVCRRLAEGSATRRFLQHTTNRGLGQTVSAGLRACRGRLVGYADVDASTSAAYLFPILSALEDGYAVAEAHRTYRLQPSTFLFILHRYLAHHVYAWLVGRVLGFQNHDTLTGFKFFHRSVAMKLLKKTQATGWFWDTEMIANAHRMDFHVAEVPSVFIRTPRMRSTVRLIPDSIRQFIELMRYAKTFKEHRSKGPCCRSLSQPSLAWPPGHFPQNSGLPAHRPDRTRSLQ